MYDVIIIGAGPGGYLAAERLGHAKKKVLLIEEQYLGGTCLNVGCIPTKTLLNSAKQYVHALEAGKFGITLKGVSFNWGDIQKWKDEVVEKLRSGVAAQMKRFAVDLAGGRGEILSAPRGEAPGKVRVYLSAGGTEEHEGRAILVSTGSLPVLPPIPGARDNPKVVDSTGILSIEKVPKRLAVIGGGVIGVEFAGLFSALGSEVRVIEMMDEIIPFMDREQAPLFRRAMKPSQRPGPGHLTGPGHLAGVEFSLGSKVQGIEGASVIFSPKGGADSPNPSEKAEADLILMAVGRRPVLSGWGAEAAGLDLGPKGVAVDDRMRTNVPGIWAAGDVTGRSLLAHSAYRMAEVAVADILACLETRPAGADRMRYNAVPWAVYGIPEAAGVGITEQEAEARGIALLKSSVPMRVSGRFVAENTFAGQGAVKVIADARNRRILGLHAVGAYASEFIWGGAALIEQELRIEDVKELIFPHPTVCELIRDAVWEL
jgi:dihydrolipoamide dehydrogenase